MEGIRPFYRKPSVFVLLVLFLVSLPLASCQGEALIQLQNPATSRSSAGKERKKEGRGDVLSTKRKPQGSSLSDLQSRETKGQATRPSQSLPPTETTVAPTEPVKETSPYQAKHIQEIISGKTESNLREKTVFLTFDDGITPGMTNRVLDVLKKEGVQATFFLVGRNLHDGTAALLRRMQEEGHHIALHSFNHNYEELYPAGRANSTAILQQAQLTLERLQDILGKDFHPTVWRYPGGHMSWRGLQEADKALAEMGLHWIDWNAMAGLADIPERRPKSVEDVMSYLFQSMKYSATQEVFVVLMHDSPGKDLIVETLPMMIDWFRTRGYQFACLD